MILCGKSYTTRELIYVVSRGMAQSIISLEMHYNYFELANFFFPRTWVVEEKCHSDICLTTYSFLNWSQNCYNHHIYNLGYSLCVRSPLLLDKCVRRISIDVGCNRFNHPIFQGQWTTFSIHLCYSNSFKKYHYR